MWPQILAIIHRLQQSKLWLLHLPPCVLLNTCLNTLK